MERLWDYFDKYSFKETLKKDWEKTNKFMISAFSILALLTASLAYVAFPKKRAPEQESLKMAYRQDLNNDGNLDFILQDIESGKELCLYRKFIKENGVWKERFVNQQYIKELAEQKLNEKLKKVEGDYIKNVGKAYQDYEKELKKYNITEQ